MFKTNEANVWIDALKVRAGAIDPSLAHPKALALAYGNEKILPALAKMAGVVLTGHGVSSAGSADDFANLLADSLAGVVVNQYRVHAEHRKLAKFGSVPNYKTKYFANVNQNSGMLEVDEAGEISQDFVIASGQGLPANVKSYAKIVKVNREVIVNDEFDTVSNVLVNLGARAGRLEAGAFYSLLESNPVLDDSENMFHVDHGNQMTPAVLSDSSLGAGVEALRNQEIEAGEPSGNKAKFLLVSPDLELAAIKIVHQCGLDIEVICSPWVSSGTWYLFADPEAAPVIALLYLFGQKNGLSVTGNRAKNSRAFALRVAYDFGLVPVSRIGVIKGSVA
ncbi:MAG: hypothetical protein AB7U63_09155 [Porticoccaceae bacterium]